MGTASAAARRDLAPRAAWVLGLGFILAGAGLVAAAIWSDEDRVQAPRWVAVAAGLAFELGGAALIKGYARDRGADRPDDLWSLLLGALIGTCITVIPAWVAFGPGERRFRLSGPIPIDWLFPRAGEWLGRAAFGFGAILVGAITLFVWARLLRRLWRRPAREQLALGAALLAFAATALAVLDLTGDVRLWPATRALRQALAAPALSDADRLQLVLQAKLANPAYVRWHAREWYRQPYQTFEEEALLKEIRSRLAATRTLPAGVSVTTIPQVTTGLPVIDGRLHPDEWRAAVRLELGHGTQLYLLSDGRRLYLGCDVPSDTTAEGFDQLRFYYHVDLAGVIVHERVHVSPGARDGFAAYRLAHVAGPGSPAPSSLSEGQIARLGHGASTLDGHRQFEVMLDLAESGLHPGVPFPAYVEVETDPVRDSAGRFLRRALAGALGSQAAPVWLVIEDRPRA
jgi:hypothetical protein